MESTEDEIVAYACESGSVKAAYIAERFKISKRAASILLRRLQRHGRVESKGYTARAEAEEA